MYRPGERTRLQIFNLRRTDIRVFGLANEGF
jgi:hypothetical protein